MIKTVLLPKPTFRLEFSIDLMGGEVFPRITLSQHCGFVQKRDQHVDMIWHYNVVEKLVSITVKMMQTVPHDFCNLSATQNARSMTCIKIVVPTFREMVIELLLNRFVQLLKLVSPIGSGGIDPV
jgi:hypothetical protein